MLALHAIYLNCMPCGAINSVFAFIYFLLSVSHSALPHLHPSIQPSIQLSISSFVFVRQQLTLCRFFIVLILWQRQLYSNNTCIHMCISVYVYNCVPVSVSVPDIKFIMFVWQFDRIWNDSVSAILFAAPSNVFIFVQLLNFDQAQCLHIFKWHISSTFAIVYK